MRRFFISILALVTLLGGCRNAPASQHDPAVDQAAIEDVLRQWPRDFNDRNLSAVCGLFAEDVVLSYPASPDRGRAEFCEQISRRFDDPGRVYAYAEPDIREILIDGDLAVVELFWTLTVTDAAGNVLDTVTEDGVDVFRRQPDGSWKIHISHAFTRE